MDWKFERIGCNIVCCYTEHRKNVIFLEYDYDLKVFKEFSEYLVTKHFVYNNRQYARDKAKNRNRYINLLSDIDFYELHKHYK